jgi:cellulose synthase/poly-beta-1,6-N-acetylglucosamine synthase-like glycosyltransferase
VLLIEIISSTATIGYAVLLIKYSKSRRTKGLPIAKKGQQPDLDNLAFHVRVLVPCYKESVDLVRLTVLGAVKAPLPRNTLRTVYLCDDGKVGRRPLWTVLGWGLCACFFLGWWWLRGASPWLCEASTLATLGNWGCHCMAFHATRAAALLEQPRVVARNRRARSADRPQHT